MHRGVAHRQAQERARGGGEDAGWHRIEQHTSKDTWEKAPEKGCAPPRVLRPSAGLSCDLTKKRHQCLIALCIGGRGSIARREPAQKLEEECEKKGGILIIKQPSKAFGVLSVGLGQAPCSTRRRPRSSCPARRRMLSSRPHNGGSTPPVSPSKTPSAARLASCRARARAE